MARVSTVMRPAPCPRRLWMNEVMNRATCAPCPQVVGPDGAPRSSSAIGPTVSSLVIDITAHRLVVPVQCPEGPLQDGARSSTEVSSRSMSSLNEESSSRRRLMARIACITVV